MHRRAVRSGTRLEPTDDDLGDRDPFSRAVLLTVLTPRSERPFARLVQRDAQRGLWPEALESNRVAAVEQEEPEVRIPVPTRGARFQFQHLLGRHRPAPASSGPEAVVRQEQPGVRGEPIREHAATSWCARLASKVKNGPAAPSTRAVPSTAFGALEVGPRNA